MDELIDELLGLARSGDRRNDVVSIDLATIVRESWQNVETTGAAIVVDTTQTVRGDPSRVQQLFENLFRNSVEHGSTGSQAPPGDAVGHDGADVTVTVGALEDGFYVEDDGPGIPEAERVDVFEAGYSSATAGTGFGLSIVRQVAEAHDWAIEITEGADGGARFEITGVTRDV